MVRLLFVDDGSRDNTVAVLQSLVAVNPQRASMLVCAKNGGKAEAVRQGMLAALTQFQPDIVGFWDADLATPLTAIDQFVQVLEANSHIAMIFGSRVKLLGRHVHRDPKRHYLGRIFATVASNVLELPIYDTQCGAKLFRTSSGIGTILAEPFLSKWIFDVEIIARYRKLFGKDPKTLESVIYEFPLDRWEDVAGSKVRPKDFLAAVTDIFKIRAKYLN